MANDEYESKGFLIIFSLQTGVCVTSTIAVTLMITVMIFNSLAENQFSSNSSKIVQYFVIYSYAIITLVGFFMVSVASFLAIKKTLNSGFWVSVIGCVYWVILSVISYIPMDDIFIYVCIDNHCPETHWMYDTRWRNYGFRCPLIPSYENATMKHVQRSKFAGCENYASLPLTTSSILAVAWALFMSYGLYIIYKYKEELELIPYKRPTVIKRVTPI